MLVASTQIAPAQSVCDLVADLPSGLYIRYPGAAEPVGEGEQPWKYDPHATLIFNLGEPTGPHDKFRILMKSTDREPGEWGAPDDANFVDVAREKMSTECPEGTRPFAGMGAAVGELAYYLYNDDSKSHPHSDMARFHVRVNIEGKCERTDQGTRSKKFNFSENAVQNHWVDDATNSAAIADAQRPARSDQSIPHHGGLGAVIAAPPERGAGCIAFPAPRPTKIGVLGSFAPSLAIAMKANAWRPDETQVTIGYLNRDDDYLASIEWLDPQSVR